MVCGVPFCLAVVDALLASNITATASVMIAIFGLSNNTRGRLLDAPRFSVSLRIDFLNDVLGCEFSHGKTHVRSGLDWFWYFACLDRIRRLRSSCARLPLRLPSRIQIKLSRHYCISGYCFAGVDQLVVRSDSWKQIAKQARKGRKCRAAQP